MPGPENKKELHNSKGEQKRISEKEKYKAMANSSFIDDMIANLKTLSETKDEPKPSAAAQGCIAVLLSELPLLKADWKKYTEAYSEVTSVINDIAHESLPADRFIKRLNKCVSCIESLKTDKGNDPILDNKDFAQDYAELVNLQGHYEEMQHGNLDVKNLDPYFKEQANQIQEDPEINPDGTDNLLNSYKKVYGSKYKLIDFGYENRFNEPLFPHEPSPDDVIQGNLGDCFLVGTLSAICAANPHFIRRIMKDNGNTVTVPVWKADKFGELTGEVKYVTVKKSVPAIKLRNNPEDEPKLIFPFGHNALWVQMMEKAYVAAGFHEGVKRSAKKNYKDINGGGTGMGALSALLGGEFNLTSAYLGFNQEYGARMKNMQLSKADEIYEFIEKAVHDGDVVVAGTDDRPNSKPLKNKYKTELKRALEENKKMNPPLSEEDVKKQVAKDVFHGLSCRFDKDGNFKQLSEHCYAVTNVFEEKGQKYVVVRNPHGSGGFDPSSEKATAYAQKGYSAIPAEEFAQHFSALVKATPIRPIDRIEYGRPYQQFMLKLNNAVFDSMSTAEVWFDHKSPEFREFNEALSHAACMCCTEITSDYSLSKAFEKLSKAAKNYLAKKGPNTDTSDARNLRISVAKAALLMAESYKVKDNPQLIEECKKMAATNMLEDRMRYSINRYGNEKAKKIPITQDPGFKKAVDEFDPLVVADMAIRTKLKDIPKTLNKNLQLLKKIKKQKAESANNAAQPKPANQQKPANQPKAKAGGPAL